jgi:iron complex transport system substrate-binding protein
MKAQKLKILLSVIAVVVGLALGFSLTYEPADENTSLMTIDFGSYDIISGNVQQGSNASTALYIICQENNLPVRYDTEGYVLSIDGQPSAGDSRSWFLYFLNDLREWEVFHGDPATMILTETSVVSWGLRYEGEFPTPATDAAGHSYYGLGVAKSVVCLAPSITETVCALGAENLIVGTDMYSNYPKSVEMKRNAGLIKETGSYTSPSFETIVDLKPDLVIGIASQYSHGVVVNKLRSVGVNAILVDDGESLQSVYDNTYITGVAMGLTDQAIAVTKKLAEEVEQTTTYISSVSDYPSIMVALSADKAPWIAGDDTYISDIYSRAGAYNSFEGSVLGWRQINPESIVEKNPQVIIVISQFEYSEEVYDFIISNLSEEWRATDAYRDGEIYVFSDSAADMLQRPSTRLAQMTEILGRILHKDSFPEDITVPKYIGNDYVDYIVYSKEL